MSDHLLAWLSFAFSLTTLLYVTQWWELPVLGVVWLWERAHGRCFSHGQAITDCAACALERRYRT